MMALFNAFVSPIIRNKRKSISNSFAFLDNRPLSSTPLGFVNTGSLSSKVSQNVKSGSGRVASSVSGQPASNDKLVRSLEPKSRQQGCQGISILKRYKNPVCDTLPRVEKTLMLNGHNNKNVKSKRSLPSASVVEKNNKRSKTEADTLKGKKLKNSALDGENLRTKRDKNLQSKSGNEDEIEPHDDEENVDNLLQIRDRVLRKETDANKSHSTSRNLSQCVEIQRKQTILSKQRELKRVQSSSRKSTKPATRECKITRKAYSRWKPVSDRTIDFVMKTFELSLNKTLIKNSQNDSKRLIKYFNDLRQRIQLKLSDLQVPAAASDLNYGALTAQLDQLEEEVDDGCNRLTKLEYEIKNITEQIKIKKTELDEYGNTSTEDCENDDGKNLKDGVVISSQATESSYVCV